MVKPAVYTIDQQKAKEKPIEPAVVTEIPPKHDAPVDETKADLEVGVTKGRCSQRARKLCAVIILSLLVIGTVTVIVLFAVHQTQQANDHGHDEHGDNPDCSEEDDHYPIGHGDRPPPPPEGHQDPHHEIGGDDGHDDHPHPDEDNDDDHHGGDDADDDDGDDIDNGDDDDHNGDGDGDDDDDDDDRPDGERPDDDDHHHK